MNRLLVDFEAPGEDPCWNAEKFRDDLASALQEICPAARVVVDESSQAGDPVKGHVELDWDGLCASDYCEHQAGCNLLIDLTKDFTGPRGVEVEGARLPGVAALPTTTIRQAKEYDCFWPKSMTVEWKPPYDYACKGEALPQEDCVSIDCFGCYKGPHPPAALLAHELIHAWHVQTGQWRTPSGPGGVTGPDGTSDPEETCTVQTENQIRGEMPGSPLRCSYNSFCLKFNSPDHHFVSLYKWVEVVEATDTKIIHDYRCQLLRPDEDKPGCGCGPYRPGLVGGVWNWVLCLLKHGLLVLRRFPDVEAEISEAWEAESGFSEMFEKDLDLLPSDAEEREIERLIHPLMLGRRRVAGEQLEGLFRDSKDGLILESVSAHGGYMLLSYFFSGGAHRLITNLRIPEKAQEPHRKGEPALVDRELDAKMGQSALQLLQEEPLSNLPAGIGGVFGARDGGATFLQLKSNGEVRAMAAKDLGFAASRWGQAGRPKAHFDDQLRGAAVEASLSWGRQTLREIKKQR